jgi:hypothetical protein
VTNNPSSLFALVYLSMLTAGRRPARIAAGIADALRWQWDSAARMAAAEPEQIAAVLRRAGAGSTAGGTATRLAGTLHALASEVVAEYHGDLRRLRQQAGRDAATVRRMLTRLPGVDDRTVDLFFREVQMVWPEVGPFADRRTLAAAARLGLGGRLADLAELTGDESEKLAWLAGALTKVDEENRYAEAKALANA